MTRNVRCDQQRAGCQSKDRARHAEAGKLYPSSGPRIAAGFGRDDMCVCCLAAADDVSVRRLTVANTGE